MSLRSRNGPNPTEKTPPERETSATQLRPSFMAADRRWTKRLQPSPDSQANAGKKKRSNDVLKWKQDPGPYSETSNPVIVPGQPDRVVVQFSLTICGTVLCMFICYFSSVCSTVGLVTYLCLRRFFCLRLDTPSLVLSG